MRQETGDGGQVAVRVSPINSYQDLEIWQLGMRLVTNVYGITVTFPREEMYGLTSQMRRAAVSVPSNIAEGYARKHTTELRQFLYVALGSLAELETLYRIACNLSYVTSGDSPLTASTAELRHKTLAFLKSIR